MKKRKIKPLWSVRRRLRDYIFLFLKGVGMGAANKVPGVSGGTVAFVAGFYEELIYSLQKFNLKAFRLLIFRGFGRFYQYVNGSFLVILFSGVIFSFFSVSQVLDFFLENNKVEVWGYFSGLILASIYYIFIDLKERTISNMLFLIGGLAVGLGISFLPIATENDALWFVFLCGIISVSGMTLPGLSGSFIVLLMGNYVLLIVDSVNELYATLADVVVGDFSFWDDPARMRMLGVLIMFVLGSMAGLAFFSQLLAYLLRVARQKVLSVLTGFITGSLGIIYPWKREVYKYDNGELLTDSTGSLILAGYQRYLPDMDLHLLWVFILIILGIGTVVYLEHIGKKNKPNSANLV